MDEFNVNDFVSVYIFWPGKFFRGKIVHIIPAHTVPTNETIDKYYKPDTVAKKYFYGHMTPRTRVIVEHEFTPERYLIVPLGSGLHEIKKIRGFNEQVS